MSRSASGPLGVRAAWCLSLWTTSLPEAGARSLRLLAALDAIWSRRALNMMSGRPLDAAAIDQVINEIINRERARIIGEAEGGLARGGGRRRRRSWRGPRPSGAISANPLHGSKWTNGRSAIASWRFATDGYRSNRSLPTPSAADTLLRRDPLTQ